MCAPEPHETRSGAAADARARAGHYYNRAWVISGGCLIWGVVTVGFSLARTLREGIFFWAFNGLGLALVRARRLAQVVGLEALWGPLAAAPGTGTLCTGC